MYRKRYWAFKITTSLKRWPCFLTENSDSMDIQPYLLYDLCQPKPTFSKMGLIHMPYSELLWNLEKMIFSVLGKNIFVKDAVSGIIVNIIQYLNWKIFSIVDASKYNIEIKLFLIKWGIILQWNMSFRKKSLTQGHFIKYR